MKLISQKHYSKALSTSIMWKMESLNKFITKYKLPISMQFKEFVFAKFIYNLHVWNMEPMNFSMEKLKNKSAQKEMKKSLMGINQ